MGYGRVRILSAEEFEEANETGELSFQDVLILARAPRDIEGVVNGIITAERQGELSHVAVRTARRGTPNAFLRTALEDFAALEGKLVRLEVTDSRHIVSEVTEREAEDFWTANAGFLSHLPSLDGDFAELADYDRINALDGGVQEAEGLVGDDGGHLAAEAAADRRLVHDHQAAGLLHRGEYRFLIQRLERAEIDHLGADPLDS